jgi:pseudaminic acid biosynthesis-associated methylase
MAYRTAQEEFWAGTFGQDYMSRNQSTELVASNEVLFRKILQSAHQVRSVAELGCNIGLNLLALNQIDSALDLHGYEINNDAAQQAARLGLAKIVCGTVLEPLDTAQKHDLTFTKGVLIHIQPDELHAIYDNLYRLSRRYVMVCEYYNPSPVSIDYRGHQDRLFKRDFAGEMIDRYGMTLVDYGFTYHRDPLAPQDDCTWFLLEK